MSDPDSELSNAMFAAGSTEAYESQDEFGALPAALPSRIFHRSRSDSLSVSHAMSLAKLRPSGSKRSLQMQSEAALLERICTLETELATAQLQCGAAERARESSVAQNQDLAAQLVRMFQQTQQLKRIAAEKEAAATRADQLAADSRLLVQRTHSTAAADRSRCDSEAGELRRDLTDARAQIARLHGDCDTFVSKIAEIEATAREQSMRSAMELENASADLRQARDRVAVLESRIGQFEADVQREKTARLEAAFEAREARADRERALTDLTALQQQHQTLQSELHEMTTRCAHAESTAQRTEALLKETESALGASKADCQQLSAQVRHLDHSRTATLELLSQRLHQQQTRQAMVKWRIFTVQRARWRDQCLAKWRSFARSLMSGARRRMLTSLLANQTNTTAMVHSDSQTNLGSAQMALQLKVDELESCLHRERDQFKAEKAQLEQQLDDMLETEQRDASLQQQQQQMQQRLQYDQLQLQIAQQSQLILTLQLQLQQRAHLPPVIEMLPTQPTAPAAVIEPDFEQAAPMDVSAPISAPVVSSAFSTPVSSPKRSPLRRSTPTVHSPPPPPRQPRSATELWRVARCYVHTRACLTRALATLYADFVDEVSQETAERCRVRGALSAFEAFDEIRSTSTEAETIQASLVNALDTCNAEFRSTHQLQSAAHLHCTFSRTRAHDLVASAAEWIDQALSLSELVNWSVVVQTVAKLRHATFDAQVSHTEAMDLQKRCIELETGSIETLGLLLRYVVSPDDGSLTQHINDWESECRAKEVTFRLQHTRFNAAVAQTTAQPIIDVAGARTLLKTMYGDADIGSTEQFDVAAALQRLRTSHSSYLEQMQEMETFLDAHHSAAEQSLTATVCWTFSSLQLSNRAFFAFRTSLSQLVQSADTPAAVNPSMATALQLLDVFRQPAVITDAEAICAALARRVDECSIEFQDALLGADDLQQLVSDLQSTQLRLNAVEDSIQALTTASEWGTPEDITNHLVSVLQAYRDALSADVQRKQLA